MKLKFTLSVTLLCYLFSVRAQSPIVLTSANMPGIGFSESYAVDTPLTSVNYGNPGANQVYDFSALTNTHNTSVSYVHTSSMYNPTAFPSANQALTSNGSFIALDSTAVKYSAVGLEGYAYGLEVNTPLQPAEILYEFPTQYQSTFASSWGFYQGFTGNQVGESSVDSVREIYTQNFSNTVDGWGKVITPVGSYRGLRIKQVDTINIEVDAYYGLFGDSWHNVTSATYYVTEYTYVSKESKGALVSFTYNDTTGQIRDAQYSLVPPAPPIAGFSYSNGSAGLVNFTDTSEGYPTRYHWSFGDGDTSNVADPNHTYAANGTYYVCETVYNPSGSNTVCDSVHITDIVVHLRPVARNDSATVHQPDGDTLNVTANDYSPSNDPFCITAVYGGQYFSVLGCNDVAFNPNPGFTGWDSCHYIVCNTGQPTLCDTGLVVIDVIPSAIHLPPVAVNDTAIDIENHTDDIDVTANDHSPSGDLFCITDVYGSPYFSVLNCNDVAFTPPANFTGYDTAWYIICNTGQPALCDTARVIVEVIDQHVPPVAVNDTATELQPAADIFDVTANDYSPSSDSFCITAIYGPAVSAFSILNCDDLLFRPDSTFTGNDTVWYVICNVGEPTLCDTASVIVTVDPNAALLPVTNFSLTQVVCQGLVGVNQSVNADSIVWDFHALANGQPYPDTSFYQANNVQYGQGPGGTDFQVCVTTYNKFGNSTKCDSMFTICEGINEVQFSGIRMYPNPASSQLTIDMRNNNNPITSDYGAIEIYNAIGQKIYATNKTNGADVVNIPVNQFAAGIYLATIVDSKGASSVLGKFTVTQ